MARIIKINKNVYTPIIHPNRLIIGIDISSIINLANVINRTYNYYQTNHHLALL